MDNKDLGRYPAGRATHEPSSTSGLGHSVGVPSAEQRREVHGVTLRAGMVSRPKIVRETDDKIIIDGPIDIVLTPASARHLAQVLYRLAGRVEKRVASAIAARSDETAQQAQPERQEPDPQGDATPTPEHSS